MLAASRIINHVPTSIDAIDTAISQGAAASWAMRAGMASGAVNGTNEQIIAATPSGFGPTTSNETR